MPAPKKVLIIDDDADYRRLIGRDLADGRLGGVEADDGEAGLEAVRQQPARSGALRPAHAAQQRLSGLPEIRGDFTLRHTKSSSPPAAITIPTGSRLARPARTNT